MRRAIDTVPRNGKFVILEDDASGSFELARWSAEARAWVREENGEISKITPTHWHTRRDDFLVQEDDEFLLQRESGSSGPSASREPRFFPGQAAPQRPAADDVIALRQVAKADPVTVARLEARAALDKSEHGPPARRRFAVSSIAAAMVAASLIGLYFRAELAAYVTRSAGGHDAAGIGTVGAPVAGQEIQFPGQDSQKADSLDPARYQQAEPDRAGSQAASSDAAQAKQLAILGAEIENVGGRAAPAMPDRSRFPGVSATAELRQSLRKERDRAEALASELARARRDIETQVALASKMGDQAAQLKQATESATAELRKSLQKEHNRAEALASELSKTRRDIETQTTPPNKTRDDAAQLKQAATNPTAELRQSKKEHDRAEALAGELATARRAIETQAALSSKTGAEPAQLNQAAESAKAELRQSLKKEHDRAEALASELAKAQRDIETQAVLASKTGDEAAQLKQLKQAAESATAELRQSLKKEHDRAEALANELARAQRDIETQVALAGDEAAQLKQLKQAAESATAELRQSLQKEHDRAEALAGELARARRDTETQVALASKAGDEAAQLKQATGRAKAEPRQLLQQGSRAEALAPGRESTQPAIGADLAIERASNNQISHVTQAAEAAAATEVPTSPEAQGSPETARLLARASALLGQGNIGAARIVLERAAETGSAQASFMLAETYDPLVLSTWRTYGTRGDATKARELYAKAHAGGIQEAKDRSDALR